MTDLDKFDEVRRSFETAERVWRAWIKSPIGGADHAAREAQGPFLLVKLMEALAAYQVYAAQRTAVRLGISGDYPPPDLEALSPGDSLSIPRFLNRHSD